MRLSAILLLAGAALIGYACSLPPYKDEALFMERYMALSAGQSKEYGQLRDEMLTPKFPLQDYGGTLIALSVGALLVSRKGLRQLRSPKSRATLFGLAASVPILTVCAYVFDILQGFARGEFPHWADSIAIPLMGTPGLLLILFVWAGVHLAFLRHTYHSELLSRALSRQANWWLLAVAAFTAVLVALSAAMGQYWYVIPGIVWLYFYISLAASRRSTSAAEPGVPADLAQPAAQDR